MIDHEAIKLHAKIAALEYFTAEAFRMIYGIVGVSIEQIEASHEKLREYLRTMEVPGDDPAISDMVAAELEESHIALLQKILNAVKERRTE